MKILHAAGRAQPIHLWTPPPPHRGRFPRFMPVRGGSRGSERAAPPPVADLPLVPSASEKRQAAQAAQLREWAESEITALEGERNEAAGRADTAEARYAEMERQWEQQAQAYEQQLASERAAATDEQTRLGDALRAQEAARVKAEEEAVRAQTTAAKEGAALTTQLQESNTQLKALEEQLKALRAQRDADVEKAAAVEARLSEALAEKRGMEALAQQSERQLEAKVALQASLAEAAQRDVHGRLESAEARQASLQAERDNEAAERKGLSTQLAASVSEGAKLIERIRELETCLTSERGTMQVRCSARQRSGCARWESGRDDGRVWPVRLVGISRDGLGSVWYPIGPALYAHTPEAAHSVSYRWRARCWAGAHMHVHVVLHRGSRRSACATCCAAQARVDQAEAARVQAAEQREASLAANSTLREQVTVLTAEKASLSTLVSRLERQLGEELTAERERVAAYLGRADAHVAEAAKLRDEARDEARTVREEAKHTAAAQHDELTRLREQLRACELELATWPTRFEAAEARTRGAQSELERVMEERHELERRHAALVEEKRGVCEMKQRLEEWSARQTKQMEEKAAAVTARLDAAARERACLIEQKEAAADGWRRAEQSLAVCEAERRAGEGALSRSETALATAQARCAKLETELREMSTSARDACLRFEEMGVLKSRAHTDERLAEVCAPTVVTGACYAHMAVPGAPPPSALHRLHSGTDRSAGSMGVSTGARAARAHQARRLHGGRAGAFAGAHRVDVPAAAAAAAAAAGTCAASTASLPCPRPPSAPPALTWEPARHTPHAAYATRRTLHMPHAAHPAAPPRTALPLITAAQHAGTRPSSVVPTPAPFIPGVLALAVRSITSHSNR